MRLIAHALGLCAAAAVTACTSPLSADREATRPDGAELIRTYGCASCHQVPGVSAPQGRVGPPLGDFGERRVIAGVLPNNPDNAVRWIRDPQDVNPETIMPDLGVTEQEARAIVDYLYGLSPAP